MKFVDLIVFAIIYLTRIESATGRSTSATDTDVRYDTARKCVGDTLNIRCKTT